MALNAELKKKNDNTEYKRRSSECQTKNMTLNVKLKQTTTLNARNVALNAEKVAMNARS